MRAKKTEGRDDILEPRRIPQTTSPLSVVGIGASAGGLKALQTFFDRVPPESGMAFVVVMHLSPDYESSLAQILTNHTSMPVTQVNESDAVTANHVYVIPPNKHLTIVDGRLDLVEPQQPSGRRISIDLFFRTLSVAYAGRAVAIILSGSDSDGAIGIKHVKEQGGLTIAQDPGDAEFDTMPRAAIETAMVDWVLPVADMPSRLMEFVRNSPRIQVPTDETEWPVDHSEIREADLSSGARRAPTQTDEAAIAEVLRIVRARTGHDFAHYKRATVLRRIARRLQVNLLKDLPAYLAVLRTQPAEVTALLHDLLISVTNFFRDPDAFRSLEGNIPQLFANKRSGDQVRVWVVGCATGEEAYSIAMMLSEHAAMLESPPDIQVFATDLDADVIQIARAGIYPHTIEADVPADRLRRHFQLDKGHFRIRKELRELVLFTAHDVLKDAPFSRLDLITCRNLLIYLTADAQRAVLDTFHFALLPGGLLLLGSSENLNDSRAMFAPLDKRSRIFVKRAVPRTGLQVPTRPIGVFTGRGPTVHEGPQAPVRTGTGHTGAGDGVTPPPTGRPEPLLGDLHLMLLERLAPPSLIVNDNYDIVHLSEHAGRFLRLAGGEITTNLLKVVDPSLRIELRTALFRATKGEPDVLVERVPVVLDGKRSIINLRVRSARRADGVDGLILVVFEDVPDAVDAPTSAAGPTDTLAHHLEDENQHLKEQMAVTVEQYEASLEELKASNEELQAVNEEMRSATEELETSKEELQSTNEELITVNQELKNSVDELGRVNGDLQNLMASTEIGTIFLDRQLRIKRFTPPIQEIFNMIPADVGRPLSDITHKLEYAALASDAERVLRDLRSGEREVRGAQDDGRWFIARVAPYRTLDDHIEGVVITFVDITDRKRDEDERNGLTREVAAMSERERLAGELHDTLAQAFTAIMMQLDAAKVSFESTPKEAAGQCARARETAEQGLQEARRAVNALRSAAVEARGLSSALKLLVDQMAVGTKVAASCSVSGSAYSLTVPVESELYRIAQEALSNAFRHGAPKHVVVTLRYEPTTLTLSIVDDGKGFDRNRAVEGWGLTGIRERTERIRGSVEIDSRRGKGTRIMVTVPIVEEPGSDNRT